MVLTVVTGPPQGTTLACAATGKCHEELGCTGYAVALVGKITVIEGGDKKHAQHVQSYGSGKGPPAETDINHTETGHMNQYENHQAENVELLCILPISSLVEIIIIKKPTGKATACAQRFLSYFVHIHGGQSKAGIVKGG